MANIFNDFTPEQIESFEDYYKGVSGEIDKRSAAWGYLMGTMSPSEPTHQPVDSADFDTWFKEEYRCPEPAKSQARNSMKVAWDAAMSTKRESIDPKTKELIEATKDLIRNIGAASLVRNRKGLEVKDRVFKAITDIEDREGA